MASRTNGLILRLGRCLGGRTKLSLSNRRAMSTLERSESFKMEPEEHDPGPNASGYDDEPLYAAKGMAGYSIYK